MTTRYAELQCTSHFSFLRGASSAEELFAQAAILGIEAVAVADRNTLSGIVRAHEAAKATGTHLVVGCRLDLADGMSLLVYPTNRPAYSRLCRLLSVGKKRGARRSASSNGRTSSIGTGASSPFSSPTGPTMFAHDVFGNCATSSATAPIWR